MKALLVFVFSTLQITSSYAAGPAISSDYLLGKWSSGGKAGCASDQATHVVFHDNHTLEAGQGRTINTVGFWDVARNKVILHLLVAPSRTQNAHPFFQQSYHYEYMAPTVLGVGEDGLEFTHDIGVDAGSKRTLTRCR